MYIFYTRVQIVEIRCGFLDSGLKTTFIYCIRDKRGEIKKKVGVHSKLKHSIP